MKSYCVDTWCMFQTMLALGKLVSLTWQTQPQFFAMIHGSRQVSFLRTWAGSEQVDEKIPVWYIWLPYIYITYNLCIYIYIYIFFSHTHIYIYVDQRNPTDFNRNHSSRWSTEDLFSTDIASLGHRVLQGEMSRFFGPGHWSQRDMTRVTVTWCIKS